VRDRLADDDPRHGTANGYKNYACRCDECRKAWAEYFKKVRKSRAKTEPGILD
jgi:hypothetical protein